MPTWLDGRSLADQLAVELGERVAHLKAAGITPRLAIIVVGNDERTASYIRAKQAAAARLGIDVKIHRFDELETPRYQVPDTRCQIPGARYETPADIDTLTNQLQTIIEALNKDPAVHGIILQLPLPTGVDEELLLNTIAPTKDVDGLTATNQAGVELSRELFPPATPMGILRLLERSGVSVTGATVAVIGQGRVVGKPLADMLRSRGANVRVATRQTPDLGAVTHGASIVISATGQANLITPDLLDDGVVLVDAGLAEAGAGLIGDATAEAQAKARLATPVRGGVGPMTVISLLSNVVAAAELAPLR